jgi:hypothetical protein
MALTGQLSDMSLAELIEFFCNQRKTGRLKIDYQRGHSVFFIKDGELVDAKVGALSGTDAVYYSLTLPNAAFDFSPEVLATRRTINEPWTQVVLEGLRRLDEGLSPSEQDAFGSWVPSESDMALMMDHVERLGDSDSQPRFSFMAEQAANGNRKKLMIMGVAASVVLVCVVAAIPLMGGSGKPTDTAAAATPQPTVEAPTPAEQPQPVAEVSPSPGAEPTTDEARGERDERDRRERERRDKERRAQELAKKDSLKTAPTPAPVTSGPKTVRVTVFYDENGRVTQASVAGASPGAESYGGTAVRVARGKRFPTGKAGSTVVTIPVN